MLVGKNSVFPGSDLKVVVGVDVSHPPPGLHNHPSIAALVSSVDQFACKYLAFMSLQEPRQEIVAKIGQLFGVSCPLKL